MRHVERANRHGQADLERLQSDIAGAAPGFGPGHEPAAADAPARRDGPGLHNGRAGGWVGAVTAPARLATIIKNLATLPKPPHLVDLDAERARWRWDELRAALAGPIPGALNLAHTAVGLHAQGGRRDHPALRWHGAEGETRVITFGELDALSNRCAHALRAAGLARGDVVALLLPRVPALHLTLLGALKAGLVACPLSTELGPEPLATRLRLAGARVLVTTRALHQTLAGLPDGPLPGLDAVWLADLDPAETPPPGACALPRLLATASPGPATVATAPDEPALLLYTASGPGGPQGVVLAHDSALGLWATGRHALDLHPDDIVACSVDVASAAGLGSGLLAPLLQGVSSLVDEAPFEPARTLALLRDEGVSIWCAGPSALRQCMAAGLQPWPALPRLRLVVSVGAPLGAAAVLWGEQVLGVPVHEQWGPAEAGGVAIGQTVAQPLVPGAWGRALPGYDAAVVARHADGTVEVLSEPGAEGELALRADAAPIFRACLGEEARFRKRFAPGPDGRWLLSGERTRLDADGSTFWPLGRIDSTIVCGDQLVAPAEVEACLRAHPAVQDAAAAGAADPLWGERVEAWVTPNAGHAAGPDLRHELLAWARARLGPALAPRALEFASTLPRTPEGRPGRRWLEGTEPRPAG
jgi:acetyl-CoA synthetase